MAHWTQDEIVGRCELCGGKVAKGENSLYCQGCGSSIDRSESGEITALAVATKGRLAELGIKTRETKIK